MSYARYLRLIRETDRDLKGLLSDLYNILILRCRFKRLLWETCNVSVSEDSIFDHELEEVVQRLLLLRRIEVGNPNRDRSLMV